MIKRLTILLSILIFLAGCSAPGQKDATDETDTSGKTTSNNEEIIEGRCPDPAIPAVLIFSHHVEQNHAGSSMSSDASGSVPIIIGTKGVNGSGEMEMAISGTFGDSCIASGSNEAIVDINGICKDGILELMITETYLGGSFTMICDDDSSTSAIPGSTISHEMIIPLEQNKTVTAPFVGEAGSGTYSWTLDTLMVDEDFGPDDIETVPLVEPDYGPDDVENVPLVPTPTS